MKVVRYLFASALISISVTNVAKSEAIVIDGRYVADSSTFFGDFYQNANEPITFMYSFGGVAGQAKYIQCKIPARYDWNLAEKALQLVADALNGQRPMQVAELLRIAGFNRCDYIKE